MLCLDCAMMQGTITPSRLQVLLQPTTTRMDGQLHMPPVPFHELTPILSHVCTSPIHLARLMTCISTVVESRDT